MTAPVPDPAPDPVQYETAGDPPGDQPERDEAAEIAAARMQLEIEQVSFETGVPAALLSDAETAEDAMRIATDALLWQADQQPAMHPPPQTGAVDASFVTEGTGVIGAADRMLSRYQGVQTRDSLTRMSPAEILSAWRSGHLTAIGVAPPNTPAGQTPMTRRPR